MPLRHLHLHSPSQTFPHSPALGTFARPTERTQPGREAPGAQPAARCLPGPLGSALLGSPAASPARSQPRRPGWAGRGRPLRRGAARSPAEPRARCAPAPPARPALSAVLNRARTARPGVGGGERFLPPPHTSEGRRGEPPSVESGWGTACHPPNPPPPPPPSAPCSADRAPCCLAPVGRKWGGGGGEGKGEEKKKYIRNGWVLPGIAASPAAASSPKSEGQTSLDPPTAPSSGPSRSHPPFPRPRLRLAGA